MSRSETIEKIVRNGAVAVIRLSNPEKLIRSQKLSIRVVQTGLKLL